MCNLVPVTRSQSLCYLLLSPSAGKLASHGFKFLVQSICVDETSHCCGKHQQEIGRKILFGYGFRGWPSSSVFLDFGESGHHGDQEAERREEEQVQPPKSHPREGIVGQVHPSKSHPREGWKGRYSLQSHTSGIPFPSEVHL